MAAARGGAAARNVQAVPDKPAPISFNLDDLEREDAQAQPFVVVLGGDRYELRDVQEVAYNDLLSVGANEIKMLRLLVRPEDHKAFFAAIGPAPMWKVRDLVQAYRDHYGMVAQGEAPASLS